MHGILFHYCENNDANLFKQNRDFNKTRPLEPTDLMSLVQLLQFTATSVVLYVNIVIILYNGKCQSTIILPSNIAIPKLFEICSYVFVHTLVTPFCVSVQREP